MNYPSGQKRRKKQNVKVNCGNNSQVNFFLNNSKVKLMCSQPVHLCVDCFANPAGPVQLTCEPRLTVNVLITSGKMENN